MKTDLILHSAAQLLTLRGGPQRGSSLGTLNMIEDGAIAISGRKILAVGTTTFIRKSFSAERELEVGKQVILPGFVDPHTHLVWMGDRAVEFERRIAGDSYMEIMAAGGGIMSTVRQTRSATVDQLMSEARPRIRRMLACGTTTAEAKTGYGLQTAAELKMLEAILKLDGEGPLELAPTFLGAHAIPSEFSSDPQGYTDLIIHKMLPAVKIWWEEKCPDRSLPFCDVFCENGAFDLDQTHKILAQARRLDFPLKVHADEFESLGGTGLAVSLGAISADHLVHTPEKDRIALGNSNTVAVALPCTPFGLAESEYTPAEAILEKKGILALASDLNPGTAWCESMQFVIALACRYLRLTPAQAIAAATINAAAAIGRDRHIGSLEGGKQADVICLDAPDYRHLGYRFGTNIVSTVIKKGQIIQTNT